MVEIDRDTAIVDTARYPDTDKRTATTVTMLGIYAGFNHSEKFFGFFTTVGIDS
jgi:hypothetical protein